MCNVSRENVRTLYAYILNIKVEKSNLLEQLRGALNDKYYTTLGKQRLPRSLIQVFKNRIE